MLRKGFTAATRSFVRKNLGLVLKKARANKENKARANKENKARANKENKARANKENKARANKENKARANKENKARANKENKARANKENKARANKENKAKCRGQEQESYEKHFIVLVYFLSKKTVFSSVSVQDSHSDKGKILICNIYFGYFIFTV